MDEEPASTDMSSKQESCFFHNILFFAVHLQVCACLYEWMNGFLFMSGHFHFIDFKTNFQYKQKNKQMFLTLNQTDG